MTKAYRIVQAIHARHAFSGEYAARFPKRWNPPGAPVVYLAQHVSLALLEVLVSRPTTRHFAYFELTLPEIFYDPPELPCDWNQLYPHPRSTQDLARTWLENYPETILRVPSVVIPSEYNFVLNCNADYFPGLISGLTATELTLDPRLDAK